MKLSDVIKVWDILHVKDTGKLGFNDLEDAIDATCGIENDIFIDMDIMQRSNIICPYCGSDISHKITDSIDLSDYSYLCNCPVCGGKIRVNRFEYIEEKYETIPIFEEK